MEEREVSLGGEPGCVASPFMPSVHPQALVRGGNTTDTTEKRN